MSRLMAVCVLILLMSDSASAEDPAVPSPMLFASANGAYGFKVLPKSGTASTGTLFTVSADGKDDVVWSKPLSNIPRSVFIAPNGKRVVAVDTSSQRSLERALTVYGDKGSVIAEHKSETLADSQFISRPRVPPSVSLPLKSWSDGMSFRLSNDGRYLEINAEDSGILRVVFAILLDSGEFINLDADLKKLVELSEQFAARTLKNDPAREDLKKQILVSATRIARYRPNELVWKGLVLTGGLKEGMTIEEAEKLLGPPTDLFENNYSWYFNPLGAHVAPSLSAHQTNGQLFGWRVANR